MALMSQYNLLDSNDKEVFAENIEDFIEQYYKRKNFYANESYRLAHINKLMLDLAEEGYVRICACDSTINENVCYLGRKNNQVSISLPKSKSYYLV